MKTRLIKIAMLIVVVVAFTAPPCLAKATGYFFVVAYSYQDKAIYCSDIFTEEVRNVSYSADEYVTEMGILQKIESSFGKYLTEVEKVDLSLYTLSSRGAFKSKKIAMKYLQAEKNEHGKKGFTVKDAADFRLEK